MRRRGRGRGGGGRGKTDAEELGDGLLCKQLAAVSCSARIGEEMELEERAS